MVVQLRLECPSHNGGGFLELKLCFCSTVLYFSHKYFWGFWESREDNASLHTVATTSNYNNVVDIYIGKTQYCSNHARTHTITISLVLKMTWVMRTICCWTPSSLWGDWLNTLLIPLKSLKTFKACHAERCRISCHSQMFLCRCSQSRLSKEKVLACKSCAHVCSCSHVQEKVAVWKSDLKTHQRLHTPKMRYETAKYFVFVLFLFLFSINKKIHVVNKCFLMCVNVFKSIEDVLMW